MVADYLPLLYGAPFSAAVPIARVLVVLLFAETAFAVGLLRALGRRAVSRRPHDSSRDGRGRTTLHLVGGAVRPAAGVARAGREPPCGIASWLR